ncbi:hypothetical protein scyTo_0011808 [Scyliorhinus torazame]|uniref:Lysosomal amino acid transporter 1 homolog n=1 Tax=Scyliorhinus torazame TaxID=75743 RepID=A0A401NVF9_SCYTO|nr:hypothetical protein [Scyliorhinus torazame]
MMAGASTGNFTSECPNGSLFVWKFLEECTEYDRDIASVALGLFSVLCFMVSAFPQCFNSIRNGNMDQAVSFWFLLGWLAGDSCNFVGAFIAQQLPMQTYTAVYYVIVDLVMVSMYSYYKLKNRSRQYGTAINAIAVFMILGATVSMLPGEGFGSPIQGMRKFTSRSLLTVSDLSANQWRRKSTEGVSPTLFALMIIGNLAYGLSVILKVPRKGQSVVNYMVHHFPWLVGSLGTMGLDLSILCQFFIYREQNSEERTPLIFAGGH